MTFVVRTSLEPTSLTPSVAAAVRAVDPRTCRSPTWRRWTTWWTKTLARPRTVSALLTVFAFIALVLAGVGVYGVMAYAVSQRTQEIGVRMALGATTQSVFRMMIGDALRLVAIGIVAGLIAAAWLSQFLTTMLFQTQRFDVVDVCRHGAGARPGRGVRVVCAGATRHEGDAGRGVARRIDQLPAR